MTMTIKGDGLITGSTAPAFSAFVSTATQTLTANAFVKVLCQGEEYDTASAYDNATNYRFQPTVPGYYHITGNVTASGSTSLTQVIATIYKNGAEYKRGGGPFQSVVTTPTMSAGVSALVYFNGTTDYVELWAYASGTGTLSAIGNGSTFTYFQGYLARSA